MNITMKKVTTKYIGTGSALETPGLSESLELACWIACWSVHMSFLSPPACALPWQPPTVCHHRLTASSLSLTASTCAATLS
jgi:hypothetical protein